MGIKLLIVESPTKAKTLSSYLPSDWQVIATKGHIKDLPKNQYGIDIKNGFSPSYEWLPGKKTLFSGIKKIAKNSEEIVIASDPDREGEIIAKHILDELAPLKKKIFRIHLFEITKEGLLSKLQNKGYLSESLVQSQIARRLTDRIFGFEISPKLWTALKNPNLSAGRVQSTVLHWICEREQEILTFQSEAYALLYLVGSVKGRDIEIKYNGKERLSIHKAKELKKSLEGVKSLPLTHQQKKKFTKNPPAPFTTASLQEKSFRSLGFSAQETLKIAQRLFEGVDIPGKGKIGLITYMRTDSTHVSSSKREKGLSYLQSSFAEHLNPLAKQKKSKNPFGQNAHEAILPIDPYITPDSIKNYLSLKEWKLYKLIWSRFLTSLFSPTKGTEYLVTFSFGSIPFVFREESIEELGFLAFESTTVPIRNPLSLGWKLGDSFLLDKDRLEEKQTEPPTRFTEGKLIQKMEETGVGRPSTYSTILAVLRKRKYIWEAKKSISPTKLGERVNEYLQTNFSSLIVDTFTKQLEETLDEKVIDEESRIVFLQNFYRGLKRSLSYASNPQIKTKEDQKSPTIKESSAEKKNLCPVCKLGSIKVKMGKKGKSIYLCSRYPNCDFVSYEAPH